MIKLVLLTDTSKIIDNWHFFAPGFREVLNYSDDESSEESIVNDLYAGKLFMQVVFVDDKYAGFFTGYIDEKQGAKKVLNVAHTYLKPDVPKETLDELLIKVDEFGLKHNCKKVRFYSKRDKAFAYRLKEKGWKQSYVCFVKPIGGENER